MLNKLLLVIFTSSLLLLVSCLLSLVSSPTPVFAQTENIKTALQGIVDSLEQLSKIELTNKNKVVAELTARKLALKNILNLVFTEANNLKNKLIKIEDLEDDHLKMRDQLLKELDNQTSYYESLNNRLESNITLPKIKELAMQFKDWRQVVYHPHLQKIINFILISDARDILQVAESRYKNISIELKKVGSTTVIKNSPLFSLLEKAEQSLEEAKELQKATELVILKSTDNDTQKLTEEELDKIKEAYNYFIEMSEWLKSQKK